MTNLSLRARMFAWFWGLAVLLVAGSFLACYLLTREALFEAVDTSLRARADEIAALRAAGSAVPDPPARHGELRGFEIWTFPGPACVARSASLDGLATLVDPIVVARLAAKRGRPLVQTVDVAGRGRVRLLAQAAPPSSVVVAVEDLGEVDDELGEVFGALAMTLPIALIVAGAGAWLGARNLSRPLREMAAAAERVASGERTTAIPGSGAGDEVDRLAETLTRTFARLREAYSRQERFSADAAHELRTPISVVLSQAEVALRRERSAGEYRAALAAIVDAARRMSETLEALLLLARGDSGGLARSGEPVDLAAAAREAISSRAEDAARSGARVQFDVSGAAVVSGDMRLLRLLLDNLLANAIAYGRAGGTVHVGLVPQDGAVTLTVRDEGAGIPASALPHVFERFFRADDSRSRASGGCGLGLSIVRLVAEIHGGTAQAQSEPGRGTCITVRLPRAASS